MDGLVISDAVKDLIINIINIIILFVIVRTLAYKPAKKFLDARKERVAKQLEDAAAQMDKAKAEEQKYGELIKQSQEESTKIIHDAEHTAKESADRVVADAKKAAAEIEAKARENAKREHDAQIASIKGDVTDLAFDISRQILSREVTDEDNMRIADSFFAEFNAK